MLWVESGLVVVDHFARSGIDNVDAVTAAVGRVEPSGHPLNDRAEHVLASGGVNVGRCGRRRQPRSSRAGGSRRAVMGRRACCHQQAGAEHERHSGALVFTQMAATRRAVSTMKPTRKMTENAWHAPLVRWRPTVPNSVRRSNFSIACMEKSMKDSRWRRRTWMRLPRLPL